MAPRCRLRAILVCLIGSAAVVAAHALTTGGEGVTLATGPNLTILQPDLEARRLFVAEGNQSGGATSGTITIFDSASGQRTAQVKMPWPPSLLALDPSGGGVVAQGYPGQPYYLIDTQGRMRRLPALNAVAPDDTFSQSADHASLLPAVQVGDSVLQLRHGTNLNAFDLLLAGPGRKAARVTLQMEYPPVLIADAEARRLLVFGNASGPNSSEVMCAVLDMGTGTVLRRVPIGRGALFLALDRTLHRLFIDQFIAYNEPGSLTIMDSRTGSVMRTVAVGSSPDAVAVDERRHHVFVALTGTEHCPDPLAPYCSGGYFNGDGQVVELSSDGTRLRTWDIGGILGAVAVDPATGHLFVLDIGGAEPRPWWLPGWADGWWPSWPSAGRVIMLSTV